SDACDKMDSIITNTEKLPYISSPQWGIVKPTSTQLIAPESKHFKISILLICIPFAIFALLLIKFAYSKRDNKKEIDTFNPF
ncbi:MAG: hypothetical protein J6Q15_03120, partial [Clostridia bacterium]|nr:hypothetical protein [Clostridia bacterium]